MSGTLNLYDRLLAIGRNYHKVQREREALHYLERLAALHDLPAELAEEAQLCLAEVYLRQRKYRRARRHLSIALLYRPDSARYHYLMATVLAKGQFRDPDRAAAHYQKSLELEPEQPGPLADFGLLCVRMGRTEEGLGALTRAVDLTPNDPVIVGKLVKGLCRARHFGEARRVLVAARFRNRGDRRFRALWDEFQFRRLHRRQRRSALGRDGASDGPVTIPFTRPPDYVPLEADRRTDAAEPLAGPHRRRPQPRADWKHG
jgi:Tfp pilus assembly protein PilF